MMKLSTMLRLVATIDAEQHSPIIDSIRDLWPHDAGPARFWRASANFIAGFEHDGRHYILRFNHADERDPASIQAELDYHFYLIGRGLRVARPVLSTEGRLVESVETPHGIYHAVVFDALAGEMLDEDNFPADRLGAWGRAVGEFHHVAEGYTGIGRPSWSEHLDTVASWLPLDETVAWRTLDQVRERLGKLPVVSQNFGLIHFDLEPDNLIWNGDRVGLVDFDDCARYWFVADIAFALRHFFNDQLSKVDLSDDRLADFMAGYREARPFDPDELELLPLFFRVHHLFTLARLLRALEDGPSLDEPDWMQKLRLKLVYKTDMYRQELAAML